MNESGAMNIDEKFNYLTEEVKRRTNCGEENVQVVKQTLAYLKTQYKVRWLNACRIYERFENNNKVWLDSTVSFPTFTEKKIGRPEVPFEMCSERTKRMKTKEIRSIPTPMLTYATHMNMRADGQIQASNLLKEMTISPKRAEKYREAYKKSSEPTQKLSSEDALAVYVDAKLSRNQYDIIRSNAQEIFPSYKVIQAEKKRCYPYGVQVTEQVAFVPLQQLLDHTADRLFQTVVAALEFVKDEDLNQFSLISKWGFDGSSGHSSYMQAFQDSQTNDSAVFITSLVPLRITCRNTIIWENPRPASTRFCRPLKMAFIKETTDVSLAEKLRVDEEIKRLQLSKFTVQGRNILVNHCLIFSMVDGKICNSMTETTSTQSCYICGATSKQFNNIDEMIKRKAKTENLGFGLSILHGWIRMYECLLHVAYKLPIAKWQARGVDKDIVSENKARIQREFREKCGLIVDKPRPGFGNTNTGNAARRFFRNPDTSSEITKVDVDLIKKFHVIMSVVSCGHEIDVQKFKSYSLETARLFVAKYPWYNMPPTLHKYFIHGPEIISSALLPSGQLTEEAQEARNKDFKLYREFHSRKCTREKSNRDVFYLLLISSDPIVTSKRRLPKKRVSELPVEAQELITEKNRESIRSGSSSAHTSSDEESENDI